jgi:hypothetical protein
MLRLVALAVGALALVASGVGGYLVSAALSYPDAPADCGAGVSVRCLPAVGVDDVAGQLRSRGFDCGQNGQDRVCQLTVGETGYRSQLHSPGRGRISELLAEVSFNKDDQLSDRALAYLGWFSALPFPHDPESRQAARAWLGKQARGRAHTRATVNDYHYELDATGPGFVRLTVQGGLG